MVPADDANRSRTMISTIITVVLILILIAALPIWKYAKPFGYTPSFWVIAILAAHFYTIATAKP